MNSPDSGRIDAFKSCLLNTCVRALRPVFSEGLTLTNCMESEDFRNEAYVLLQLPLCKKPVEPAMEWARLELMSDMVVRESR